MFKDRTLRSNILLYAARAVGFAWACFWIVAGITTTREGLHLTDIIMNLVLPAVISVAMAAFAWRWPRHGAAVFLFFGVSVLASYPLLLAESTALSQRMLHIVLLGVPPLVAGILLLLHIRAHPPTFPFKTED